jgi:hypothetical protein
MIRRISRSGTRRRRDACQVERFNPVIRQAERLEYPRPINPATIAIFLWGRHHLLVEQRARSPGQRQRSAPTVVVPADPATPVRIQDSMLDTAISPTEANPRNRTRCQVHEHTSEEARATALDGFAGRCRGAARSLAQSA